MSAVQLIPKAEARPGDRVREVGLAVAFERMPKVVRVDAGGLVVTDDAGHPRLVPLSKVEKIVRAVSPERLSKPAALPLPDDDDNRDPNEEARILAKFMSAVEELRGAGAPASQIAGAEALARAAAHILEEK